MAGRVAEIDQPPLGQHDQLLAVGKDDLVDLRLDLLPGIVPQRVDLDLAVEVPMLQTMARAFICRMWTIVIASRLPVAVTRMSPCEDLRTLAYNTRRRSGVPITPGS